MINLEKINSYLNNLNNYLQRNSKKILVTLIFIYIIIFSILCLYKYFSYNYIGIDLAIFNQVFYNSSQGNFFDLTIHPHLYLGDHFALIIPLLIPFYFLLKSPITLLILQSFILALGAWPIYLIARQKLSRNLSLIMALFYLSHLFIHNINTYEFHIISLAILLLLFLFYFYKKKKFGLYVLLLSLCLLIREDVALVIFMFGLLAAIEKRSWKWIIWPLLLSTSWFILAMKMTGTFSDYGQYKFISYYGWLGSDLKSIILGVINHPWLVVKHIFSGNNISFLLGLFIPFAFLPLIKPKYILLSLLVILQILFLTAAGVLALEIHYTALIIPSLFISTIYAIDLIINKKNKNKIIRILHNYKEIVVAILLIAGLYSTLVIGPLFFLIKDSLNHAQVQGDMGIRNYFTKEIPEQAAVATGFHFLPRLSSRKKIYSLHYQYLGKKQYSNIKYRIPNDVDYALFDMNDFLYYQFLYPETDENNIEGVKRLRELIKNNNLFLSDYIDKYFLYTSNINKNKLELYKKNITLPKNINQIEKNFDAIKLNGFLGEEIINIKLNNKQEYKILPLTLYWTCLEEIDFDYQIKFIFTDDHQKYEKKYTLSSLYPTHEWQKNETVKINYRLAIPKKFNNKKYQISLKIYHAQGNMGLNKSKIFRPQITKYKESDPVNLLWITPD